MNRNRRENLAAEVEEAVTSLREAAISEKCRACGCLHNLLEGLQRAFPDGRCPKELEEAVGVACGRLLPVEYDCLGCEVCFPALVINALHGVEGELSLDLEVCPTEKVEARPGWPPLPGDYRVLRYHAPVVVCTLMDDELASTVAGDAGPEVAIVGTMKTENLGIERLMQNVLANPHLRFVVLCGPDSQQAVGHWPGQSLVALAHSGVDEHGRINGARGKRPFLLNLPRKAVEHFRRTVEIVDLISTTESSAVLDAVRRCALLNPGPAAAFTPEWQVPVIGGYLPPRMVADPEGYFVIYLDRTRRLLSLEHYRNDGVLDAIIQGSSAAELYIPAIDRGMLSRLDHAAYLGRELARAEEALRTGEPYVQDAAPERCAPAVTTSCGCGPSSQEGRA